MNDYLRGTNLAHVLRIWSRHTSRGPKPSPRAHASTIGVAATPGRERTFRLSGRRVLVTGARGFIGSHLCDRLSSEGAEVHAVSRYPVKEGVRGARWWQSDLLDLETSRASSARRARTSYFISRACFGGTAD